jgi:tetratricopeptide (TPR) repeat protein
LTENQRQEVLFKKGYVYFVNKKFKEAREALSQVKETQGDFYGPANYYYGMTAFFEGDYDDATKSFQRIAKTRKYKAHVPFYLTQIYFAQGDYDKVINYAVPLANDPKIKKRKEMHQLIGQAYFEKQQYTEALPYLEFYAESASKMREEEFYQLAFTQYKTQNYKEAADNFEQLSGVDSEMGQNALYNLGDSYIKLNKKEEAREAFGAASRMDYDKTITEEALFTFGKLSYELNADRDAVTAFQSISPSSR